MGLNMTVDVAGFCDSSGLWLESGDADDSRLNDLSHSFGNRGGHSLGNNSWLTAGRAGGNGVGYNLGLWNICYIGLNSVKHSNSGGLRNLGGYNSSLKGWYTHRIINCEGNSLGLCNFSNNCLCYWFNSLCNSFGDLVSYSSSSSK
jgi:hypothetical protein